MDLYVIYEVETGYEEFEKVAGIFFNETNARKELENIKDRLIAIRADNRFKKWWTEEPLDPFFPETIAKYRLYDEVFTQRDSETDILLEIRVLQTGDEPYAERGRKNKEAKSKTSKKPSQTEKD